MWHPTYAKVAKITVSNHINWITLIKAIGINSQIFCAFFGVLYTWHFQELWLDSKLVVFGPLFPDYLHAYTFLAVQQSMIKLLFKMRNCERSFTIVFFLFFFLASTTFFALEDICCFTAFGYTFLPSCSFNVHPLNSPLLFLLYCHHTAASPAIHALTFTYTQHFVDV